MADISKVTLPNDQTVYNLKDSVARGGIGNAKLFYGTCSSAAAATEKAVTCSEFTSSDLVAGTMINVKFDATNSGAIASLAMNVNGTGAKRIKYIYNKSLNDIPAASYLLKDNMYTFRYDGTYWVVQLMYDSNTTVGYGYIDYYFRPYAGSNIYRYKLCLLGEDNRLYPIVTTDQTSTTQVAKSVQSVGLKPTNIWVYYATTTINAGGLMPAYTLYDDMYLAGVQYNFNSTIPAYTSVYLRGAYDKDKDLFYLYDDGASATTSYYATVPTNIANVDLSNYLVSGDYYMLVGGGNATANYIQLFADNPLYYFDGTNLIPVSTKVAKDEITSMVGTDEQEDNSPYSFRKTANGKISGSPVAAYDELVGGSIVWNQYLQTHTGYSITTGTGDGLTISVTDGWVNIVGTPTALTRITISPHGDYVDANHKILFSCDGYNGFDWERGGFTTTYNRSEFVHTHTAAWSVAPRIVLYAGTEYNIKARFNATDLTEAFGIDIADYIYNLEQFSLGSGVAWLREDFIEKHHEYSVPTFQHVQTSEKITVGFNQWDEQTEMGYLGISNDTIVKISGQNTLVAKNLIPVLGGQKYHFNTNQKGAYVCVCKNADGSGSPTVLANIDGRDFDVTIPNGYNYIRFHLKSGYGTTYRHNVCVNLHGDRDGEYEPYCKRTYPIEAKVLRGVPKLDSANRLVFDGDVYRHDGTIERRMYTVNSTEFTLGTYDASTSRWTIILPSSAPEHKYVLNSDILNMIPTNGFPVVSKNNLTALSYGLSASDASVLKYMILKLDATQITTLTQATEWLQNNPFELIYEVNEPTIEAAEPYQYPMACDGYGTEEFIDYGVEQSTRDIAIPVGHNTKYRSGVYGEVGLKADTSYVEELISDIDNSISDIEESLAGTLPIAHGGTGATTASGASNNLLSGLPDWTAVPTDDTKLVRRDTGGSPSFGQVKFSTIWSYIKSKTDSFYQVIKSNSSYLLNSAKYVGSSTPNKYARIKIPNISTIWTMLYMEVNIRGDHGNGYGGKVLINTYHNATSPYTWSAFKAAVIGILPKTIAVYGSDGQYIYVKMPGSTYQNVSVDKMLIGDGAATVDASAVEVDFIDSLPTTYQTANMQFYATTSDIPTKTSDLTNDSGFITTETDPTVPSWAKQSTKPTYTASEVGAVPTTRKVNNKALSSDITLTASDVGALPADNVLTVDKGGTGLSSLTSGNYIKANSNLSFGQLTPTQVLSDIGAAASGHTHTTTIASGGTSQINLSANTAYTLTAGGTNYVFKTPADSDTKNTAGSTDTSSEIYLVGATSQAANPQTYSHDTARVRANGMIASSGYEFATASAMGTTKAKMIYDSTLEAIAFQFD